MVLHFDIVPDRSAYFPGEIISATAEVCNLPGPSPSSADAAAITVVEVNVQLLGTELVDPAYISSTYHQDVPADTLRNSRRLARQVFRTPSAPLGGSCVLQPGDRKEYHLRFQLPDQLPPTFKGASLRFDYAFEAEARYLTGAVSGSSTVALEGDVAPSLASPDAPATPDPAAAATVGEQDSDELATSVAAAAIPGSPSVAAHTLMQSMLLKVPLQIWPLDGIERGQSAPFLAGSEAEAAMPSVVYELGCPGYDLTMHVLEDVGDSGSGPERRTAPRVPSAGQAALGSKNGGTRYARQASGVPPPVLNGKQEGDEDGVDGSPLLGAPAESQQRRMSRWSTADGSLALPALIKVFNIRVGDDPLVRLCLHPPLEGALMPGGTLMGTLDFRASQLANVNNKASPKCIMLAMTLETEEVVAEKWLVPSRSGTVRKIYDEHVELTPDTLISNFAFTIPRDSPPSFSLPVASLRWLLRFEYNVESDISSWTRSTQQTQLLWKLPVLVRPPC